VGLRPRRHRRVSLCEGSLGLAPEKRCIACIAELTARALTTITMSGFIKPVRIGGLIAKRWPVVGGVLLVAAMGWAGWRAVRHAPTEPVYEGEPISYWLASGGLPAVALPLPHYRLVINTIGAPWARQAQSGSNAVPHLVKALERRVSVPAAFFRKWVWPRLPASVKSHLRPPLGPSAAQTAAYLLGQMGPMAEPAIPALVRALEADEDPRVRGQAAQALGNHANCGKTAKAALAGALTDKSPLVRSHATNALLHLSPAAAAKAGISVPDLVNVAVAAPAEASLVQPWPVTAPPTNPLLQLDPATAQLLHPGVTNRAPLRLDPEAAAKAGVR
jgi:hypothetical protein